MDFSLGGIFDAFKYIGSIVCAIFFFFSGYGMHYSIKKFQTRNYRIKRIATVYIPFVIANVIFLIHEVLFRDSNYSIGEIICLISGVDLINGHAWFLQVLIIIYLCCFCFYKNKIFLIFSILIGGGIYIILLRQVGAFSFIAFTIGLSWKDINYQTIKILKIIAPVIAIVAFIIYVFNTGKINTSLLLINFILLVVSAPIMFLHLKVSNDIIGWIGKNSMAFYITHGLILKCMINAGAIASITTLILFFCLSLIVGLIFLKISNMLVSLFNNNLIVRLWSQKI